MTLSVQEIANNDMESIDRIGKLRYDVWKAEGALEVSYFPAGSWTDPFDYSGRHWVVVDSDTGDFVAAARLNFLVELDEQSRDALLWKRTGSILPLPTVDFGRLVVNANNRRQGLAQRLNEIRVVAAQEMGAKSIIVTASEGNASLLRKSGFFEIGQRIEFDDRPGVSFIAMQKNLI
jgi:predicted GNAT family N-acyltransferase|eukprot:gene26496-35160_t